MNFFAVLMCSKSVEKGTFLQNVLWSMSLRTKSKLHKISFKF